MKFSPGNNKEKSAPSYQNFGEIYFGPTLVKKLMLSPFIIRKEGMSYDHYYVIVNSYINSLTKIQIENILKNINPESKIYEPTVIYLKNILQYKEVNDTSVCSKINCPVI